MTSELHFRILSAPLIIKGFTTGYPNCNYEIYLRELINHSKFFLSKSNNEPFSAPQTEESGQCDCISQKYELDFKLFISETMGQGKREFSPSITIINDIARFYGESNTTRSDPKYKEIQATYLHVAFRKMDLNDIIRISNGVYKQHGLERDINLFLNKIQKPKNILFFIPCEFYYTKEIDYSDGRNFIIAAFNSDFANLLEFRYQKQPKYDTYFAFFFKGKIVYLQAIENELKFVDEVEVSKSKTFMELSDYSY